MCSVIERIARFVYIINKKMNNYFYKMDKFHKFKIKLLDRSNLVKR